MNQNDWHRWHKDRDYDNTTSGVGVPDFVFAYGNNKFGLTPVTDKAYTVKYNYWRDHTELSLHSDTTDIPSRYDWVIVNGALYYGDLLKADIQRASKAEEKFEEGLKRMANTLIDRDENISSTVINGGGSRSRASGYVTTT
jgi:hypothetical protein